MSNSLVYLAEGTEVDQLDPSLSSTLNTPSETSSLTSFGEIEQRTSQRCVRLDLFSVLDLCSSLFAQLGSQSKQSG